MTKETPAIKGTYSAPEATQANVLDTALMATTLQNLAIENKLNLEKLQRHAALIGEIGQLISLSGLPSRLGFRTIIANWRKVGELIEAIVVAIKIFRAANADVYDSRSNN